MRWLFASALVCAACASAGQSSIQAPAQPPARIDATGGGYDVMLNNAGQPVGQRFAAPPDRVWPIAVAAFSAVGLRIDGTDARLHQVETRGQVLRRQLNGISLSVYFDCGNEMSGSIADSWRLRVDARMAVTPAASADSAQVMTLLSVNASPVEGTSTQLSQCSSRGRLEARIAQVIREALAHQQPR